jgi:hypothetical protein
VRSHAQGTAGVLFGDDVLDLPRRGRADRDHGRRSEGQLQSVIENEDDDEDDDEDDEDGR